MRIAKAFVLTGAVFALAGMVWGIQMSATHDHTFSPAHGHLNLIGFVAMSLFGGYYALTPAAAASRLAVVHYWLTVIAVVVLVPGIVMAIAGTGETAAKIGSIFAVLSMGTYCFIVARKGIGAEKQDGLPPAAARVLPAE